MTTPEIAARLEELRTEIRAERISWGELAELQGLAEHIDPGDVELLEWAGVPENPESWQELYNDVTMGNGYVDGRLTGEVEAATGRPPRVTGERDDSDSWNQGYIDGYKGGGS